MDINELLDQIHLMSSLGDLAKITPGYYPRYSRVFQLKDCPYRRTGIIEGWSECLHQFMGFENDAVHPLVQPSEMLDFKCADDQQYSACLITADHTAPDFALRYPLTARYLTSCANYEMDDDLLKIEPIVRSGLREAVNMKKVIISTQGDICHAMLDTNAHVVSTKETYLCTFYKDDLDTLKAYTALFNSKLITYLFYKQIKDKRPYKQKRIEILENMPIPYKSGDYTILECLADCLFYLSSADAKQLSYRIDNDRIRYYLLMMLDMVVYEMYFPEYMQQKGIDVIRHMLMAPCMFTMMDIKDRTLQTYEWFQKSDNRVRINIDLLDLRSPNLLYPIHSFTPDEQD